MGEVLPERDLCSVFIVDDGSIFVQGLSAVFSASRGIDVAGTTRDIGRAVDVIRTVRPRVVIATSEHEDVVWLIGQVGKLPGEPVPVLAIGEPGPRVAEALLAGACGTLSWRATAEQISSVVLAAARGVRHLPPDVAGQLMHKVQTSARNPVKLSNREIEVLLRAADGQTNSRIARALSLSEATVKTYWQRVFKKLDVHDRTMAVTTAMGMGILTGCSCPRVGPMAMS